MDTIIVMNCLKLFKSSLFNSDCYFVSVNSLQYLLRLFFIGFTAHSIGYASTIISAIYL